MNMPSCKDEKDISLKKNSIQINFLIFFGVTFEAKWITILKSFVHQQLQWIFWVGPFIGAAIAAIYHVLILRAGAVKALGSFRSNA